MTDQSEAPTAESGRLAARLRSARISRGLSYRDAAAQIGLAPSVLHQIETGTDPRYSTALRVIAWLEQEN